MTTIGQGCRVQDMGGLTGQAAMGSCHPDGPASAFDEVRLRNDHRLTYGGWTGWTDIQGIEATCSGTKSHKWIQNSVE